MSDWFRKLVTKAIRVNGVELPNQPALNIVAGAGVGIAAESLNVAAENSPHRGETRVTLTADVASLAEAVSESPALIAAAEDAAEGAISSMTLASVLSNGPNASGIEVVNLGAPTAATSAARLGDIPSVSDDPGQPVTLSTAAAGSTGAASDAGHTHAMPTIAGHSLLANASIDSGAANDVITFKPSTYLTVDSFSNAGVLEAREAPPNSMRLRRSDSSGFHAETLGVNSLFLRGAGNIVQAVVGEGQVVGRPAGGALGAHAPASLGVASEAYVDSRSYSGTYTPTFSDLTGVSGLSGSGFYTVVDGIVSVTVQFSGTATAEDKSFQITLPAAPPSFSATSDAAGVASSRRNAAGVEYYGGAVQAVAGAPRVVVEINNPETSGSFKGAATFTYAL